MKNDFKKYLLGELTDVRLEIFDVKIEKAIVINVTIQ